MSIKCSIFQRFFLVQVTSIFKCREITLSHENFFADKFIIYEIMTSTSTIHLGRLVFHQKTRPRQHSSHDHHK